MQELPIEALRKIEKLLHQIELRDLVSIFSNTGGDDYLLVYNSDRLPARPIGNCRLLGDLNPSDYAHLDGLTVGFSAIDIILPDVPTHGVHFHPIEDIFARGTEKQKVVQQTAFRFAKTLLDHLDGLPATEQQRLAPRAQAKTIQLFLPTLLTGHPLENLAAVLLEGDLRFYVERRRNCRLIYNDPGRTNDIDSLRSDPPADIQQCWMAAIEEITQFLPECSRRLIELRPILRQLNATETLRDTLRQLAHRSWRNFETSDDHRFLTVAYSMAAEANLEEEDVEHLVALFPHQDFSRFVENGDALRIYRIPILYHSDQPSSTGPRYSLGDLLGGRIKETDYAASPLSFPILAPALKSLSPAKILDLGPVLWKMGEEVKLARTLMLLSRDILKMPSPDWLRINASPEAISDMALRAMLIYGLANPWLWQTRYKYHLRRYYEHLSRCLRFQKKQAEDSLDADYFEALRRWYDSYTTDSQAFNLKAIVDICQNFLASGRETPEANEQNQVIENLLSISKSLIARQNQTIASPHYVGDGRSQPFNVANYLREIVAHQSLIKPPSDPFKQHLHDYQSLHAKWRGIQGKIETQPPSFEKLDQLLAEYKHQQRTIYASPHELKLLYWVLEEDVRRIGEIKQAIKGGGPIISVRLVADWVTAGIDEKLIVEVKNLGGDPAYQLRLELSRSPDFDLLSERSSFILDGLPKGESRRLEWRIRARSQLASLTFKYSFQDHNDRQYADIEATTPVEVFQPRDTNVEPKGRLFQAGIPVYGGNSFFGRVDELRKILGRLSSGITQPVLLRGPRRMGKSSTLKQLQWLLEKPERCRVLNLSPSEQIQLSRIHPIFVTLQAVSPTGQDYVAYFFQAIFEDICADLELPYNAKQVSKRFARSPARAFVKQMDAVFRERVQIRLLVFIDEWDELNREGHDQLSRNLRAVMETEKRINWIYSSTWTLSVESGQYGSPFYNQSLAIELKEMDWEAAVDLIKTTSKRMDVVWRPEAVLAVLEQTGRRPYLTQLICARIIDYLHQQSTNLVDVNAVTVVISQFLRDAASSLRVFNFIWSDDTPLTGGGGNINGLGRLILYALDTRHPEPLAQPEIKRLIEDVFSRRDLALSDPAIFNQTFIKQMTLLEKIFDVIERAEREGDEPSYQFCIPLQRAWFHQTVAQRRDLIGRAHSELFQ